MVSEQSLTDALNRLINGTPTNPVLKMLFERGKLRISFSSVAKEAGCSRTLIGHENCKYPRARLLIKEYTKPIAKTHDAASIILRLREQVADLKLKLENALTQVVSYSVDKEAAQKDAARWKGAYDALIKRVKESKNAPGNVVPLRQAPESNSNL